MIASLTPLSLLGGARFAEALRLAPLSTDSEALLSGPSHVLRFRLPVRMENGGLRVFTGWRIRYSDALGPTKGGVRFHPDTNEAELTSLAFRLLLKCAVNGLPHGGAGGGVAVDHRTLSRPEREQLARAYVDALGDYLSPERDILSPDIGTDTETMRWMAEQYTQARHTAVAAAINGKPAALGGIAGRPEATARGAWTVLREVLCSRDCDPTGLTCAVQGYGSAGGRLAVMLQQQGFRLVAASDASGGWYDSHGLDAASLWEQKIHGHRFADIDLAGAARVAAREVLAVKADVVVPAAIANQVTAEIAAKLQCQMLLEIANGPTTPDAEEILAARGIIVIPDLVANAGGVTMSHFEWAQNVAGAQWTDHEAGSRLDRRMADTAQALIGTARCRGVSLAVAAQLMALERLTTALA